MLLQRILDRVRHRLANWRMGSLPFPGRLVLAKHTLKAVPIYLFSAFQAPKYFIKQVKKVVAGFLWGKGEGRGIHWKRWDDFCKPLGHGGLGLRDFVCFNQALLAKLPWRLIRQPESLAAKVLLGKYCWGKDFWWCDAPSNCSWGWRSILWGRELLRKGLGWRLGDGRSISVFKHQWIPKVSNPYVESRSSVDMLDFRVADLIDEAPLEWRKPLIEVLFPREIVPNILAIHIPSVARQDELIWRLSKNGVFSVKSAYFEALRMHSVWEGVGEGEEVWRKVWGLNLPPKLALFL